MIFGDNIRPLDRVRHRDGRWGTVADPMPTYVFKGLIHGPLELLVRVWVDGVHQPGAAGQGWPIYDLTAHGASDLT